MTEGKTKKRSASAGNTHGNTSAEGGGGSGKDKVQKLSQRHGEEGRAGNGAGNRGEAVNCERKAVKVNGSDEGAVLRAQVASLKAELKQTQRALNREIDRTNQLTSQLEKEQRSAGAADMSCGRRRSRSRRAMTMLQNCTEAPMLMQTKFDATPYVEDNEDTNATSGGGGDDITFRPSSENNANNNTNTANGVDKDKMATTSADATNTQRQSPKNEMDSLNRSDSVTALVPRGGVAGEGKGRDALLARHNLAVSRLQETFERQPDVDLNKKQVVLRKSMSVEDIGKDLKAQCAAAANAAQCSVSVPYSVSNPSGITDAVACGAVKDAMTNLSEAMQIFCSPELKEKAMEELQDGITIADFTIEGQPLIYCNAGFTRVTGYSKEMTIGRNCRFLQGPGTDPASVAALRNTMVAHGSCVVQLVNYRYTGEAFINYLSLTPILDETGQLTHYVGIQSDITELLARKAAEMSAREEAAKAEAATESKSKFLANMSHEIRTPLNGMIAVGQMLADSRLTPAQRELVTMIRSSGEVLLSLITDILDFSRIEANKLVIRNRPFNVIQVIESAIEIAGLKAAQKKINLAYHVHDMLPKFVKGDANRLQQILLNLLNNVRIDSAPKPSPPFRCHMCVVCVCVPSLSRVVAHDTHAHSLEVSLCAGRASCASWQLTYTCPTASKCNCNPSPEMRRLSAPGKGHQIHRGWRSAARGVET